LAVDSNVYTLYRKVLNFNKRKEDILCFVEKEEEIKCKLEVAHHDGTTTQPPIRHGGEFQEIQWKASISKQQKDDHHSDHPPVA
jgi:hypothetical protein